MAFVFRSPRITNLSQIESNTDPYSKEPSNNSIINSTSSYNSYINKTNTSKKYKKKNAPFGTFTNKNPLYNINKEEVPGPGSYEITSDFIKNKFNKNETSPDEDIYLLGKNKRLFISKKDRLSDDQYETEVPGPGKYFRDNKKKFNILNNYKTAKDKSKWIKPEKNINYEPFSTSRILSIPSKGLDFGYELNKKGELILSQDPNKNIKFLGTKNNSVGPGQYNSDIYNKKNKEKGIIDWNKSLSFNKSIKKESNSVSNNNTGITNLSENEISKNYYENKSINNNSISIINFNKKNRTKNYFYNGWDIDRKNFEIKFSNNKIFKNDNFAKTINRSNLSPFFKQDIKPDIPTKTESDYFLSTNCFTPKTINENNQFFGSTSSRGILFPKSKNNDIKRNDSPDKDKIQILSKTLNLSRNIKKGNNKNIIIKKIDKSELIKEISKSLKKEYTSNPGPGTYDPKFIPKNTFSYEIGNFGSLERRFPVYEKTTNQEGSVISYLHLDTWGPKKRTNYLKKILPNNIMKKLKEGISINKMNIFREKIMKETRKQPPLGTYDVEKINTIESKIKKEAKLRKNSPPFGSSNQRVLIEAQIKQDKNIGNIEFIKETKLKKKQETIFVPFLSNTTRNDIDNYEKENLAKIGGKFGGPGYYKTDSYFDWNKKSYNILFN